MPAMVQTRRTGTASKRKLSDETTFSVEKTTITSSEHDHHSAVFHSTQSDKPAGPINDIEGMCSCSNIPMLSLPPGQPRHKKRQRTSKSDALASESLPARTDSPWKVGAHVSAAGGVENVVLNAARIG